MTFEESINRANQNPTVNFHVFGEYSDGSRGYFTSRVTLIGAAAFARQIIDPIIYDRDGKEVDPDDDES